MSNEQKPTPTRGVPIELDRTRYLRYPLSWLKKLQSEGESDKRSLGEILLIGLQKDDPSLTLEALDDLIDLENLHVLFAPVKRATGGLIDLSKVFKTMVGEDPQTPPPTAGSSPDGQ